jgi:hypothetical protein
MSTQWYVRPVLWQQSLVNARLSRVVNDLAQWQAINAQQIVQLRERVAILEEQLANQKEPS